MYCIYKHKLQYMLNRKLAVDGAREWYVSIIYRKYHDKKMFWYKNNIGCNKRNNNIA